MTKILNVLPWKTGLIIACLIVWHIISAGAQERRITELDGSLALLRAELTSCTVEKDGCSNALAKQTADILKYQQAADKAEADAAQAIEQIRAEYAGRKAEVVYKLIEDSSCENRLKLISESQRGLWERLQQ